MNAVAFFVSLEIYVLRALGGFALRGYPILDRLTCKLDRLTCKLDRLICKLDRPICRLVMANCKLDRPIYKPLPYPSKALTSAGLSAHS